MRGTKRCDSCLTMRDEYEPVAHVMSCLKTVTFRPLVLAACPVRQGQEKEKQKSKTNDIQQHSGETQAPKSKDPWHARQKSKEQCNARNEKQNSHFKTWISSRETLEACQPSGHSLYSAEPIPVRLVHQTTCSPAVPWAFLFSFLAGTIMPQLCFWPPLP